MADWTAPFKLPKLTTKEYERQKAKYNKAHGYAITFPALTDIIQLNPFKPMTDIETYDWKNKNYGQFTASRLTEISVEKKRRKDRILSMLQSPSPEILRSAGSFMVALDNAQDALSTLACIGMITAAVVGGTTAAVLAGPIGWVAGTAALLNLINPMSLLKGGKGGKKTGKGAKKELEKFSDKNPFSKKAKALKIAKIMKFRPTMANAIEALQVTQNIFGVGISLGPIMGLVQDIGAGLVRQMMGEQVEWRMTPPKYPDHVSRAAKSLKAQSVLHGIPWKSDALEETMTLISANLSLQVITPWLEEWNPCDQVVNLENVMIQAPRPEEILTIETIKESGYSIDDLCNWPQTGKRWISLGELSEATAKEAAENLTHFAEANPHSPEAYIAGQNAHDFALGAIEALEGPGSVMMEYSHTERILITILMNGWCYPDDITDAQVQKFEEWVYVHEYMNTQPSGKDIWRYAEIFCGFKWAKSPDEYDL